MFESLFYCQELLEEVMKIKTLSKLNKLRLQRILNSMNSIACLVPNPKALGVANEITYVAVAFILMIASYFWGYVLLLLNDKPIIAYSIFGFLFIGLFDFKGLK